MDNFLTGKRGPHCLSWNVTLSLVALENSLHEMRLIAAAVITSLYSS